MLSAANILRDFEDLDLSGVAFSAALSDGCNGDALASVGGTYKKLQTAVPRIHTVVMAEAQRDELLRLGLIAVDGERQMLRDPNVDNFQVVLVSQVDQVPALLTRLRQRHHIDCCLKPVDLDYVRRPKMLARVESFIANTESGYMLLVGGAGIGKTSLIRDLIHARQERASRATSIRT